MKKNLIISLLLFNGLNGVYAQRDQLDGYLKTIKSSHVIPGFSVVVVKNEQILFEKGYGVERIGEPAPFTTKTILGIGSIAKSFTSMAIMQLVEKGKLELDKPVINYLPWFRTANRSMSDLITVRMLINNTSGLYSNSTSPVYERSDRALEIFTRNLASVFLIRMPGASYEYSNAAFSVAGLLVGKISGKTFARYLEEEIFAPLNMKRTHADYSTFERFPVLPGHYAGIKNAVLARREKESETGEYVPAGLMFNSCAEDMGNYLMALLNGGAFHQGRVLRDESVAAMWKMNVDFPGLSREEGGDGSRYGYGLGWMISDIDGRQVIHHGGSTGKSSSFTMIDPVNKTAVSILMNLDLTFIDKYSYPTLQNIAYNILQLAGGFSISGFGRPIVKDPTSNTFELNPSLTDRFIGDYLFKSGGDNIMYFGVNMNIHKRDDGMLTGTIYRGDQTISTFMLDFINVVSAVTRNIDQTSFISFSVNPQEQVMEANVGNLKLLKKSMQDEDIVKTLTLARSNLSFDVPVDWRITQTESGFDAVSPDMRTKVSGSIFGSAFHSFDSLLRKSLRAYSVEREGKLMTENRGQYILNERAFLLRSSRGQKRMLSFYTRSSTDTFFVQIISDVEEPVSEILARLSLFNVALRSGSAN